MKIHSIYMVVFMTLLSGCSALRSNVALEQPKEGPRARVRVITPSVFNEYRGVRAYPNQACIADNKAPGNGNVVGTQFGFEKSLTGQKLGMPESASSVKEDNNQAEVFVAANQPITFKYLKPDSASVTVIAGFKSTVRLPGCIAAVSFIPEAGADYELVFGDDSSKGCGYSSTRLSAPTSEEGVAPKFEVERVGPCNRKK